MKTLTKAKGCNRFSLKAPGTENQVWMFEVQGRPIAFFALRFYSQSLTLHAAAAMLRTGFTLLPARCLNQNNQDCYFKSRTETRNHLVTEVLIKSVQGSSYKIDSVRFFGNGFQLRRHGHRLRVVSLLKLKSIKWKNTNVFTQFNFSAQSESRGFNLWLILK